MTREKVLTAFKKQRPLIPILLLIAYCIGTLMTAAKGSVVLNGEIYDFILTTKHYLAFGAIGVNLLTYVCLRSFYKFTLGLTVLAGLFNLIIFSDLETTIGFTINKFEISFQPSAFFAGLIAYLINFRRINDFIIDHLTTTRTLEEQEKIDKTLFAEGVQKFKEKYENYSFDALTEIVNTNRFVPEAVEAARQLLNERKFSRPEIG